MKLFKRSTALLLALLMSLSLAACGAGKNEPPVSAENPQETAKEEIAAPGSDGPSQPETAEPENFTDI